MTGASDKSDRAGGPTDLSRDASQPEALIPSALFNYSDLQKASIRYGYHPDCCTEDVCLHCGASEANGKACGGVLKSGTDQEQFALELFEEAACSAHNANIKSIGQFTNWKVHDRHARAFDRAARLLAAQAIEARRAETLGSACESAVAESDAPETPLSTPLPSGSIER